jgi:O-antigen/teichoic acid export membrane protein
METRNKKLVKDIFIYGIGNLGAKFITFLIFPLYSFFIEPDNIGYYDNALAIIFLLIPFVNLQLRDGAFRFLIDEKDESNRKAVINQNYHLLFRMMIIASLTFIIVSNFVTIRYISYIFGLLLTMSVYEVQLQIVRGLGYTKSFVAYGLVTSLLILLFTLIFVVVLKWNIEGTFVSNIMARLIVLIIIEIRHSLIHKNFQARVNDKKLTGKLLKYCLPLIIALSLMWIISNLNRYFINKFVGLYEFGIFTTAFKFAGIIDVLAIIILQAWQETSILQFNAKDRDKYYSSVLNFYILMLVGLSITLSFVLKEIYPYIVDSKYHSGIVYIYILCIAEIGYALQGFISAFFSAKKDTIKVFYVTFVNAIISLALNYILIKYFAITGAVIALSISFFLMFVLYYFLIRKSAKITISVRNCIIALLLLTCGGFIFYCTDNILYRISYWFLSMTVIYFLLPKQIVESIKNRISNKISHFKK